MGCGVPAGIYAHIRAQSEPALKYPPLGSHWTFPSIWPMSHLHSPVFQTASTESTQPSLQRLWQASLHFSLLTEYSICLPGANSISREYGKQPIWSTILPCSQDRVHRFWSQMPMFHSPLCPSHLCCLLVLPPPTRFSPSFRCANSWGDWCLFIPNHSQD